MKTYETILERIKSIPSCQLAADRDLHWLTEAKIIGITRDEFGHLEIFLTGEEIKPSVKSLAEMLEYHSWFRADGSSRLRANRLTLPAYGHYDQVAALICTELLREGAEKDLRLAFARTEPLIELAIRRLNISKKALIGLAGELVVLDRLSRAVPSTYLVQLIESWQGWKRSSRDLIWEGTGLEIKTTTRDSSIHPVSGLHQVEIGGSSSSRGKEERLLLVSVGIQEYELASSSFSIPMLAQRIVDRLHETGAAFAAEDFLEHLSLYGADSGFGYRHDSMSDMPPYNKNFVITFVRAFDMEDRDIKILRSEDLLCAGNVIKDSLRFSISLPATINNRNPINGLDALASDILNCR